jgi:ParB family chromosome partitioning protein
MLSINKILADKNVRGGNWEKDVKELAERIRARGMLVPALVEVLKTPGPRGETHRLVYGYRRLAACKLLSHTEFKVTTTAELPEKEAIFLRIVENSGRADLQPLEEAVTFGHLINDLGCIAKDVAASIGMTESYVSQRLALLKLPEQIKNALEHEKITATHARDLARIKDEKKQERFLEKAESMPAAEFHKAVEEVVAKERDPDAPKRGRPEKKKPESEDAKTAASNERPQKEIMEALHRMDALKIEAAKEEDKVREAHLKGIIKGIMWAAKMKSVKLPE